MRCLSSTALVPDPCKVSALSCVERITGIYSLLSFVLALGTTFPGKIIMFEALLPFIRDYVSSVNMPIIPLWSTACEDFIRSRCTPPNAPEAKGAHVEVSRLELQSVGPVARLLAVLRRRPLFGFVMARATRQVASRRHLVELHRQRNMLTTRAFDQVALRLLT